MKNGSEILRKLSYAAMAAVILLGFCSPSLASSSDEWEIMIAPYFFVANPNYDATIDGITKNVDLSFSDIWDDFDVLAGSLHIEAFKGDWGVVVDSNFTDLDGDFGPRDNLNAQLTQFWTDVLGAYRIKKFTLLDRPFTTDIMGGLRYHYLKQKGKFDLPGPGGPGPGIPAIRVGTSEDWIEPVIGAKSSWHLTEKWSLQAGGTVGGFDIGSASKLTWVVNSYINYQFARHWSFALGYRYFNMDYSKGSGQDKFGFDGYINGIMIGFVWRN